METADISQADLGDFDDVGLKARRARKNRKRDAMENADETSFDEAFDGAPKKRRRQEDLKKKHNITSQKGRQKINEAIQTLKQMLLPNTRASESNKASILQAAISTIETSRSEIASLHSRQQALEDHAQNQAATISDLLAQLNTLRASNGLPAVVAPTHVLPAQQDAYAGGLEQSNHFSATTSVGSVSSPGSDVHSTSSESDSVSPHEESNTVNMTTATVAHDVSTGHGQEFAPVYEFYNPGSVNQASRAATWHEEQFDYYGKGGACFDGIGYHIDVPAHNSYYSAPPVHGVDPSQYARVGVPVVAGGAAAAAPNQGGSMSLSTAFNLGLFAVFFLGIFPMFMISQGFEGASLSFIGTTRSLASVPFEPSMATLSYFHRSSSFWSGLVIFVMLALLVGVTWWALRKVPLSATTDADKPIVPPSSQSAVYAGASLAEKPIAELIAGAGDMMLGGAVRQL
eukprot:TRINITY_DN3430_c0_g1_i1.p1 TRINITY_DN3430_c0_g1~~TRINITY_DN3430_c0_g1_i1.p1  ORF type:complete len:476 (+),score=116.06 TRINITY_DN3430_c0_g1_i1:55-1428(+)